MPIPGGNVQTFIEQLTSQAQGFLANASQGLEDMDPTMKAALAGFLGSQFASSPFGQDLQKVVTTPGSIGSGGLFNVGQRQLARFLGKNPDSPNNPIARNVPSGAHRSRARGMSNSNRFGRGDSLHG